MQTTFRVVLLSLLPLAAFSAAWADAESAAQTRADLAMFLEEEPGIEAYPTRMLVTEDFLRMDDGVDGGDFILFDRKARTISSVSHANQSILRIYPHAVTIESPIELEHEEVSRTDPNAPTIGGRAPVHLQFTTNDETCVQVMAVPGLLENVRAALIEYRETLAGEQSLNLYKTPADLQTPCMLSDLIFAPSRHLQGGFPVQQWDPSGYSRALVDYREDAVVDSALFEIPLEYSVQSVNPAD